jgi:hypothetical protein
MLLQNVRDLFREKNDNVPASKKIYSITAECLDTLSDISKKEKKSANHPIVFNLLKDVESCKLNVGIVVAKDGSPELKKILDQLRDQSTEETRKKFFEKITQEKKVPGNNIGEVLSLMMVAIKSKRKFNYQFDSFSEDLLFLTLKFEVEYVDGND